MKHIKKISIFILVFVFLFVPLISFSQGTVIPVNIRIQNPFNCGGAQNCNIMTLITAILNNIIMPIAAVGVVVWIVWSGFAFIQAQGNSGKLETARKNLLWSLIGAGVLLGAAGIARVVENTVRTLMTP